MRFRWVFRGPYAARRGQENGTPRKRRGMRGSYLKKEKEKRVATYIKTNAAWGPNATEIAMIQSTHTKKKKKKGRQRASKPTSKDCPHQNELCVVV